MPGIPVIVPLRPWPCPVIIVPSSDIAPPDSMVALDRTVNDSGVVDLPATNVELDRIHNCRSVRPETNPGSITAPPEMYRLNGPGEGKGVLVPRKPLLSIVTV